MRIAVNGTEQQVPEGTTLKELIRSLKLDGAPCAAEVNKSLVPRRQQDACTLQEGDRIELVTLVGGG
jgi:sulfur carrier protein